MGQQEQDVLKHLHRQSSADMISTSMQAAVPLVMQRVIAAAGDRVTWAQVSAVARLQTVQPVETQRTF